MQLQEVSLFFTFLALAFHRGERDLSLHPWEVGTNKPKLVVGKLARVGLSFSLGF